MLAVTRSIPDVLVFIASALIILSGAVGVVICKNPVHSALSLIGTLLGVALAFVEQQAHFLAAAQIIVYAGAIVILFLFVIMFLGVDREERISVEPLVGHRALAISAVGVIVGGLIALIAAGGWYSGARSVAGPNNPSNDVGALGKAVFTTYLFAFEATALLLIIAVVGAVLLARRQPEGRSREAIASPGEGTGPEDDAAEVAAPSWGAEPDDPGHEHDQDHEEVAP
jgi:NADH-quinone oxidoreductase subunit J